MFNMFVYILRAEIAKTAKETYENNLQIVFTVICCCCCRCGCARSFWGHSRLLSTVLNVGLNDAYEFGVIYTKARTRTRISIHKECVRERTKSGREWKNHTTRHMQRHGVNASVRGGGFTKKWTSPRPDPHWTKLSLDRDRSDRVFSIHWICKTDRQGTRAERRALYAEYRNEI